MYWKRGEDSSRRKESRRWNLEERGQSTKFYSGVDLWLAAVMLGYVLVSIGVPLWHLFRFLGEGEPLDLPGVIAPLLVLAMVSSVSVPCFYELRGDMLRIHSGLLVTRIPILAIRSVRATRTLVSAPAWSVDRLEIRYGAMQYRAIISPARKAEFLRALIAKAPQLEWDGGDLAISSEWLAAEKKGPSGRLAG